MRARAGNQAGFTMVEIMVAMVLAAIAIIGLLALYITQTRAGGFSRHSTEAAVLAQDKVEQLRTVAAANLTPPAEVGINERGLAGGMFTRTTTEAQDPNGFYKIDVSVTWTDDGGTHTVRLTARRDP